MLEHCDYCGKWLGILNLRKRRAEYKGQDLTFCSPQCRNRFMRDIEARNVTFTVDKGRPFEISQNQIASQSPSSTSEIKNYSISPARVPSDTDLLTCGRCSGKGSNWKTDPCEVCEGKGVVRMSGAGTVVKCARCKGKGWNWSSDPCGICDGKGWVRI